MFSLFSVASAITILRVVNGWIGAIILKTTLLVCSRFFTIVAGHIQRNNFISLWRERNYMITNSKNNEFFSREIIILLDLELT